MNTEDKDLFYKGIRVGLGTAQRYIDQVLSDLPRTTDSHTFNMLLDLKLDIQHSTENLGSNGRGE